MYAASIGCDILLGPEIAHCIVLGIENAAVVIVVRYRSPSSDALGDLPVGAVPYFLGKSVQYLVAPFPGLLPNLSNCADELLQRAR